MIERTLADGILTLRLAHGKASALDVELLEALLRAMETMPPEARAVIVTGTGSIFSAGVDLVRLTKDGADYVRQFLPLLCRMLRTFFAMPRPVVVAANGHAIAGGGLLVMAGDVRLMAEGNGRVGVPELLVGVPFPAAALEIVRFAVRRDLLPSLVYLGRTLPSAKALAAGIVEEVVAPDQLLPRALEIARQLAAIPAETFRLTKQELRAEALQRIDAAMATGEPEILKVWTSPETQATIEEYLRKTLRK